MRLAFGAWGHLAAENQDPLSNARSMNPKQRKVVRGWREQLLTLVNGWDPAGLLAAGAPRNEYDCIVDKLLSLLARQGTVEEVAAFLESEISEHFGTDAKGADQFAKKAVNWFRLASSEQ